MSLNTQKTNNQSLLETAKTPVRLLAEYQTDVDPNARTLPEWMDPFGQHGQMNILLLTAETENLPLNLFIVGKSIEKQCGKLDSANTEQNGTRFILKTRNADQAKKLVAMKSLIDGTKINVVPHPILNTCRCVVSNRETISYSEEDIKNGLSDQGVLNVRRIMRKEGDNRINTPTLILTINGTVVPRHIFFGPIRVRPRPYYPSPMVCFNCFAYGHTKAKCKNAKVCRNCSTNHPFENETCNNEAFCKNCKGDHSPTNRKCPQYIREEKIIKIKVDTGVTFIEARREYEKSNGSTSFAAVTSVQNRLTEIRSENNRNDEVKQMKEKIEIILVALEKANKRVKAQEHEIEKLRSEKQELTTALEINSIAYTQRKRSRMDTETNDVTQLKYQAMIQEISDEDNIQDDNCNYTPQATTSHNTQLQHDPDPTTTTSGEDLTIAQQVKAKRNRPRKKSS